MTENELISQYSEFGYFVGKFGSSYSIFDRRLARRIAETNSFEELSNYAEKILLFPFMAETLKKTVDMFSDMYSQMYPKTATENDTEKATADPEQEATSVPGTELFEKVCPTCGKTFKTSRKQTKYCCPEHYPSEMAKHAKNGSEVV